MSIINKFPVGGGTNDCIGLITGFLGYETAQSSSGLKYYSASASFGYYQTYNQFFLGVSYDSSVGTGQNAYQYCHFAALRDFIVSVPRTENNKILYDTVEIRKGNIYGIKVKWVVSGSSSYKIYSLELYQYVGNYPVSKAFSYNLSNEDEITMIYSGTSINQTKWYITL